MATFVIVHGGFGGGWEWSGVARLLRRLGHEVYTPTLSGLGDRSHLAATGVVGLSTHVEDIVGLIEIEDLDDVIVVASDYGGIPATVAAERVSPRVKLLVYVDALVPYDGESALDLLSTEFALFVQTGLREHGETWRVPALADPLPPAGWQTADQLDSYNRRLRDQPVMTFVEPAYLTGAINCVEKVYIRCVMRVDFAERIDIDPIRLVSWRARVNGWHYREMAAQHDPHLTQPLATAIDLSQLAAMVHPRQETVRVDFPRDLPRQRDGRLVAQNWAWN